MQFGNAISEWGELTMTALAADVVVIGGGVTGLWLRRLLRDAGYSTFLLESGALGGQQTCHSHVYIHRGYIYNRHELELAARLRYVTKIWTSWCQLHPNMVLSDESFFGFRSLMEQDDKLALWAHPSLQLESARVPSDRWPLHARGTARVVRERTRRDGDRPVQPSVHHEPNR